MGELVIVLGPTGVGKSDYAVDLALSSGCPIVNCDSRQIYKELKIGVARPSDEQLSLVKHYLVATHSVERLYSAGDYEREAVPLIESLLKTHEKVVMVGGSGMYIDAVCRGLDDFPDPDLSVRDELIRRLKEEGVESLSRQLKEVDPEACAFIDFNNHQRIIRALEVFLSTGKKYSSYRTNVRRERSFSIRKIGIRRDREVLYDRINRRVDIMMEEGLLDEVRSVEKYRSLAALNTVGYREFFESFDGLHSLDTAVELVKRNSRHYAKKQMTYWRRDEEIEWIDF